MNNGNEIIDKEPKLYNRFEKLDKELLKIIDTYSQSGRETVLKFLKTIRSANIVTFFSTYYKNEIWNPDASHDIDIKDFLYELHNIINKYDAYDDIIEKNINTYKFAICLDIAANSRYGTLDDLGNPIIDEENLSNPVYSIIIYLKGLMYLYAEEQMLINILTKLNPDNKN